MERAHSTKLTSELCTHMCTHTTHTQLILTEKSQNWLKNEQKIWNSNHFFKTTARQDAHVHSPNKHTQRTEVRGHSSQNSRAAWATYWCLILKSKYLLKTFFLSQSYFLPQHTHKGALLIVPPNRQNAPQFPHKMKHLLTLDPTWIGIQSTPETPCRKAQF